MKPIQHRNTRVKFMWMSNIAPAVNVTLIRTIIQMAIPIYNTSIYQK